MMRVQDVNPFAGKERAKLEDTVGAQARTGGEHHGPHTRRLEPCPDRTISKVSDDQAVDTVPAGFDGEPLYHALESADGEILH
jgi:hypothetical protein